MKMTDEEFQRLMEVWRRAGFDGHAIDFSFIDEDLVRRLTATVEQYLVDKETKR